MPTEVAPHNRANRPNDRPPWPELDRPGLRRYGLMMASVIAIAFGLALPWLLNRPWPQWPWLISGVFLLTAILLPQALKPVYNAWMRLGLILGWINSRIILSIVYYLLLTPISAAMRLSGKDPLKRRFKPQQNSYLEPSKPTRPDHMNHPY